MTLNEIIECIKEVKEDYWEDDGYGHETSDCQRITTALDEAIERLEQEPCGDAISMDKTIVQLSHLLSDWDDDWNVAIRKCIETVKNVPPVTPQYTEAEIQKMQDLEFAEIQKAYEIGKAEGSEVLDKIRAEIEAKCCITVGRENDGAITLHDVFEIIDKYKASQTGVESEVQDANSD